MRGSLETIVGAMFAGKTSELLKRILWAKHQNKKIVVIKPSIDDRYSESKIITHNDLSHECFSMKNWDDVNKEYSFKKDFIDMVFVMCVAWRLQKRSEKKKVEEELKWEQLIFMSLGV